MEKEIWRIVPSKQNILASSLGRIMLVPYYSEMPHGGKRVYGGEPTSGTWNREDSRFQYLYEGKIFKVARLVCEAFHGESPQGKNICMHLDENSENNRPSNLKWGTQKENLNFPGFISYCKSRTGKNSPTFKGRLNQTA